MGAAGPAGPAGPLGLAGSVGMMQQKCKDKLAAFATWMQNNPQAQVSLDTCLELNRRVKILAVRS
jgi:hypothetical protein